MPTWKEHVKTMRDLRPQVTESDRDGALGDEVTSFAIVDLPGEQGVFLKLVIGRRQNLRLLRLNPVVAQMIAIEMQAAGAKRGWLRTTLDDN